MNLILCNQKCVYQREGYCNMGTSAPVSAFKVDGCNYYRPIKQINTIKSQRQTKTNINLH